MSKSITFTVNEDTYDKFIVAIQLSGASKNEAIEKCMRSYIADTFARTSQEYGEKGDNIVSDGKVGCGVSNNRAGTDGKTRYGEPSSRAETDAKKPILEVRENSGNVETGTLGATEDLYYAKAIQQIPVWALSPEQYNHRIIRAYYKAIEITGEATIVMMERLCSEKKYPELYVPSFRQKFELMEVDGPKNRVKVFEDDGRNVWIWSEVERILLRYRQDFRE